MIPEVTLSELLAGRTPIVEVPGCPYIDGATPWIHALPLISLAVVENPQAVLEIGTIERAYDEVAGE